MSLQHDESNLESILSKGAVTGDFVDVEDAEKAATLGRSVCLINAPGYNGELGTGVLIAPRLVLTNYHILDSVAINSSDLKDKATKLEFVFGFRGQGIKTVVGDTVKIAKIQPLLAYSESNKLDFALLQLEQSPHILKDSQNKKIIEPLLIKNDKLLRETNEVWIVQHPQGQPLKFAQGKINHISEDGTRFQYPTNTERGSSGSPVFDKYWDLIGLHHSGQPFPSEGSFTTGNEGIPLSKIWPEIQQYVSNTKKKRPDKTFFVRAGVALIAFFCLVILFLTVFQPPKYDPAFLESANKTFFKDGELQKGLDKFNQLTKDYSDTAEVWRDYGHSLHLAGLNATGIEQLQKASQLNPKDALTLLYLTHALLDNYRYSEAEISARTAYEIDQSDWVGNAALALYYSRTYKPDLAMLRVGDVKKGAGKAVEDPYYNLVLSNSIFVPERDLSKDNATEALFLIEKTHKAWPNLPTITALEGMYLLQADTANREKGLSLLQGAYRQLPQSSVIFAELAYYYVYYANDYNGKYDDAQTNAKAALKLNPSNAMAYQVLGEVAGQKQNFEEAYTDYRSCTALNSLNYDCYSTEAFLMENQASDFYNKGKISERDVLKKSALELILKALSIRPGNPDYHNWAAYYYFFYQDNLDKGVEHYRAYASISPNEAFPYIRMSLFYWHKGVLDKAQETYITALRKPNFDFNYGDIKELTDPKTKLNDNASNYYQSFLKGFPDDDFANIALIRSYLLGGQKDKAQLQYDMLLKLPNIDPNRAEIKALAEQLSKK